MKSAGHEVEVHGYEHLRHPHVTRAEVEARPRPRARSARRRDDAVADSVGASRGLHAPTWPRERGLEIVGWSTDTHDWRGDSAEAMLDGLTLEHGGIVLAHDGISVGARRDTRGETARLVAAGRRGARERGA